MYTRRYFLHFLFLLILPAVPALSQVRPAWDFIEEAYENKAVFWLGAPVSPNPYLSILPPGTKADYESWTTRRKMDVRMHLRQGHRSLERKSHILKVVERESVTGEFNDTPPEAELLDRVESRRGRYQRAIISGISGNSDGKIDYIPATAIEDDGSIPLANDVSLDGLFSGRLYEGEIQHCEKKNVSDFDFYKVSAFAGSRLIIDVETLFPLNDLDPVLSVLDEQGNVLVMNDDGIPGTLDSRLEFDVMEDGDYYIVVAGFDAFLPANPFDSGSGSTTGNIGSEGKYTLSVALVAISIDTDFYNVYLRKGDVFAGAIRANNDGTRLQVRKPDGQFAVSSTDNTTFYPESSPVNMEGVTSIYHQAETDGWHSIGIENNYGQYELEVFVSRPLLEEEGISQIFYLDFDGGEFDFNRFFNLPGEDVKSLSAFRDFLPYWGLPDDEQTVRRITNRITAVVRENVQYDILQAGINPHFSVIILNNSGVANYRKMNNTRISSAEQLNDVDLGTLDAETSMRYAQARRTGRNWLPVSNVIIGGTIDQAGIATVGIAESNDVGNFETVETALVLLDRLSAPAGGDLNQTFSLNDVPLAPGTTMEDLVVTAIGNIISHEIGHLVGNWHTDGFNDVQSLMDEGQGGLDNYIGIRQTGVFSGAGTLDIDFNTDAYSEREVFRGTQDTRNQTAFGLSSKFLRLIRYVFGRENDSGIDHSQSYPNPGIVRRDVSIRFNVDETMPVQVKIFSFDGREVARIFDETASHGTSYEVAFNPAEYGLEKGLYIYRVISPKGEIVRKMLLDD